MTAVLWADIAAWKERQARISLLIVYLALSAAGFLFYLRPEMWMQVVNACLLWVGWQAGRENWSLLKSWDWIRQGRLTVARVIAGKSAAAVCLIILHSLPALPLVALMVPLWGIPWAVLGRVWLVIFTSAWLLASAGLLGGHITWTAEGPAGTLPAVSWLVFTAVIPLLRPVNPFLLVGRIALPGEPAGKILPCILVNLGLSAAFALVMWILNREMNREGWE